MDRAHLSDTLQGMAARLFRQGMVKNGDPAAWHSHFLRHSFETEASHAGVKAEVRDFFMGHIEGIQWTYNHRDELHEEDLVREYGKVEPFVSLEPTRAAVTEEFEGREKLLMGEFLQLKRNYEELKGEIQSLRSGRPSPRADV